MSKVISPTVSRKIWYRPSKFDVTGVGAMVVAGHSGLGVTPDPEKTQPLDATVTAVWGDRCINVSIRDAYGKFFAKTSVTLLQPGDPIPVDDEGKPVGGYCEWMPYQIGQAKTTEADKAETPKAEPEAVSEGSDATTA